MADTNTAQALVDECAQLASQYAEAYRHTDGTKSYDQWAALMQAIRRLASLASQAAEHTVRVCPERDVECGERSVAWCSTCPKKTAEQVLRRTIQLGSMLAIAERRDAEAAIERILTALAGAEQRAAAAEAALQNVRECLEKENERGAIADTLWFGPSETLFDYIDAHLQKKGE